MEFTINRDILLKSLGHAYGIIEKKNALPILSNILLEAKNSKIKITATDLDIIYSEEVPAEELKNLPIGQRMVASVGAIPGGAIVEREINLNLNSRARLYMNLRSPDFTTAFRLAKLINQTLGIRSARAKDAGTVEISVPDSYLGNTVELVSYIENLEISPDNTAQVVLDERSGTVVMGGSVRISPIAISQNGLSMQVKLPSPEQQEGAENQAAADANTLRSDVFMLKGGADLKEIVDGFNKIGASSRDLIEVLKSVKAAGALHADLVIR